MLDVHAYFLSTFVLFLQCGSDLQAGTLDIVCGMTQDVQEVFDCLYIYIFSQGM